MELKEWRSALRITAIFLRENIKGNSKKNNNKITTSPKSIIQRNCSVSSGFRDLIKNTLSSQKRADFNINEGAAILGQAIVSSSSGLCETPQERHPFTPPDIQSLDRHCTAIPDL